CRGVIAIACAGGCLAVACSAAENFPVTLAANATVDSDGIFLSQLLATNSARALPQIRIADAPAFGQATVLTRAQIMELALRAAPELVSTNWTGAVKVRVLRRARSLGEVELKEQLTAALQRSHVGERGELELRLARPWIPQAIPDEPFTVKVVDVPAA